MTPDAQRLLQELGIDPKVRAEELEIADFCRIANALRR
jgi:16S rRNA A1518/A1519 N6-dimethyltransferase RsmA/KsgA/DIM1 with predicted DNA glycosylase/AP lyase activity